METFTIVALVGLVIGLGAFAYNWKKKKQDAKQNVITPPASLPDAKLPKPRTAKAPK